MTKDDLIAELRETIAYLRERLAKAEAELDRIRAAARDRQSRKRSRHGTHDGTQHGHVTVTLRDGGIYRGESVPSSSGSTELTDEEPKRGVTSLTPGESREGSRDGAVTADPDWDAFREGYPKLTQRTQWSIARRRWNGLSQANRALALAAVPNYAASRAVAEGAEMAAQRWLNERWWESWQQPEKAITVLHPRGKQDVHSVIETWLADGRAKDDVIDVTPL